MRFFEHKKSNNSARLLIERNGGASILDEQYDMLMSMVKTRPSTGIVNSRSGDVEGTYAEMLRFLKPNRR